MVYLVIGKPSLLILFSQQYLDYPTYHLVKDVELFHSSNEKGKFYGERKKKRRTFSFTLVSFK
jgi:hypothetical protein